MNKVDEAIRLKILQYPGTYRNRFKALEGIITTSSFEWDENGCLVDTYPAQHEYAEPTIETMLSKAKEDLAKAEQRAEEEAEIDCLASLNLSYVTDAKRRLLEQEFIADNLEAYVTTYAGCDHKEYYRFLFYYNHHGINKYWEINNPPENIDEEWRAAIYKWVAELLPTVNSLFGADYSRRDKTKPQGWSPRPGFEEIFNWAYSTWEKYQSEADREAAQDLFDTLRGILDEAEDNK